MTNNNDKSSGAVRTYWSQAKAISALHQTAACKGYTLIAGIHHSAHGTLHWMCSKGHRFSASRKQMHSGKSCPHCMQQTETHC